MFLELMEKSCRTGEGWNDSLFQAMFKMGDDTIQKMMDKMRHNYQTTCRPTLLSRTAFLFLAKSVTGEVQNAPVKLPL